MHRQRPPFADSQPKQPSWGCVAAVMAATVLALLACVESILS